MGNITAGSQKQWIGDGQGGGQASADGAVYGYATSSYIGFYGTTPRSQRAGSTQAAVTVSTLTTAMITTTTNSYGFATTTQGTDLCVTVAALVTLVNEIRTVLSVTSGVGIMKGAA